MSRRNKGAFAQSRLAEAPQRADNAPGPLNVHAAIASTMCPSDSKPPMTAVASAQGGAHEPDLSRDVERAVAAYRSGALDEAERLCRTVLDAKADHVDALHVLGVVAARAGRTQEGLQLLARAAAIDPTRADVWISHGNALRDLARFAAALESYERAIALRLDFAEAYNNRGNVLRRLQRPAEALASYERALALKPDYADAYCNRGNALGDLKRHAEALASYERALALKPGYADAFNNRGNALREMNRYPEALASYERAIELKPGFADAHCNRGAALADLKRYAEAIESYELALELQPDHPFLQGIWLRARMQICLWRDLDAHVGRLERRIEGSEKACSPFAALSLTASPSLQRTAAETWVREFWPNARALRKIGKRARHDRIRVGYFSADFRDHPVSSLTAEMFERHDRSTFEVIAFSYGPQTDDGMRKRLVRAFDRFLDVRALDDDGVARLADDLEVDIAVDLGGYTAGGRPGIFARGAAPLQASYLGYPGTMGAPFVDYLIADRTIVPDELLAHYSERIVYLPSYQASDSTRRIADRAFTREELGLPSAGFVFCCFNNSYKITPAVFDRWMAILEKVGNSVLLLYAENGWVEPNLRKEAAARGVDPRRLVFASRLPMAEYLARYRAADLFLDTSPYNAGATGSDALWAGLPVLTCRGETFAGRMGASLLTAIGLPELIASTPDAYERLAVDLASDPGRLGEIRRKLSERRRTTPLFDMGRFIRHLEAAYTEMVERHHAGLPPEHIHVQP